MRVSVIVHPNSKSLRREEDLLENLHVYVNAPPLEGKANSAAILALAGYFKTTPSNIRLISGAKSRYKLFQILP